MTKDKRYLEPNLLLYESSLKTIKGGVDGMIKKRLRRILVILAAILGTFIMILLMWQVVNVIHAARRGVPLELYRFFGTRKLVDNINRTAFLKNEGKDADYVFLFEYNDEAAKIIEESEKSGKWKAFPIDPEVFRRNDQLQLYSGWCLIIYGWADFIDELPISEEGYDGYWTYIDHMKRRPDGSIAPDGEAMLMIDDKPNQQLIFIEIDW